MKLTQKQVASFQKKIFSWWSGNKRDLPWRHTHDPYKIMVSEVMLQQTQVSRVLPKYREFVERYLTVKDLAKASTSDVLKTWKGMGYNRRALYLKQAAQAVVEQYGGKFPKSEKELVKLPGLGIYTARAILVFAYRQNIACVDTNIRQIITHFFLARKIKGPALKGIKGRALEEQVEEVARQLIPPGKSWEWHQALMDYRALAMSNAKWPMLNKQKKKTVPFKETDRFYRGRIIDLLREGNLREGAIVKEFQKKYGKSREFTRTILAGLTRDGLISGSIDHVISLPE